MNIPLKNTFLRIKLHWVPGNATFFKSRNSNNLVNFKMRNGSMQLQKVYLGAMIVSQFPLGITAAVPALVWLVPAVLYLVCISLLPVTCVPLFHP